MKIYEKNNHKDLIEHIIEIQNLELAKLKLILRMRRTKKV